MQYVLIVKLIHTPRVEWCNYIVQMRINFVNMLDTVYVKIIITQFYVALYFNDILSMMDVAHCVPGVLHHAVQMCAVVLS